MIELRELHSIDEVPAARWNALTGTDCPFLRHEFLAALEHAGCVGKRTGWTPAYLAATEQGQLVAAADHGDLLLAKEESIAGRAGGNALALEGVF